MSPKKSAPEVSAQAVEDEIAMLAGESSSSASAPEGSGMESMFASFLKAQESHNALVRQQNQALLSAVQKVASPSPQQVQKAPVCASQPDVLRQHLRPAGISLDPGLGGWEEVEDEGLDDEELDFDGWSFPPSGSCATSDAAEVSAPVESAPGSQENVPLDEGLFQLYGLPENWALASEIADWLPTAANKNVPKEVLKVLQEEFHPAASLLPYFVAPGLPATIR